MRVADAIADWMYGKGITHAFGVIGGGNAVLFDAIQKAGKITIVCCHHEQAAAMSSCYFNRIRGGLESVVLCTTGAGSTNAITGVMAAWMDSIPLLVLSGNDPYFEILKPTRVKGTQGYDSALMASQFTVHSARVISASGILTNLERCWREALGMNQTKRQGPAWLDVSKDKASATI